MYRKYKNTIPYWLLDIEDGEYTLKELSEKSGRRTDSIGRTMRRLKIPKIIGNFIQKNIIEVKYDWKNPNKKEEKK